MNEIKIYIEEAEDLLRKSPTYKRILEHRRKCKKWGKEFCLECFGGGLTHFLNNIRDELSLVKKEKYLNDKKLKGGIENAKKIH